MLIAVNYHYVRPSFDTPYPGVFGATTAAFTAQLEELACAGEFVSIDDLLAAVRGRRSLPERSILITFDDGLREQYEHAWPILQRLHVPAVIFVNTRPVAEQRVCTVHKVHLLRSAMAPQAFSDMLSEQAQRLGVTLPPELDEENMRTQYPFDDAAGARLKYLLNFGLASAERECLVHGCFEAHFGKVEPEVSRNLYLSPDEIRELGSEDAIGSHGHDHVPLALIGARALDQSLARSSALLSDWMGKPPLAISYPYGTLEAVTWEVARSAARHHFEVGFTVEMAGNLNLHLVTAPLLLARYDCNYMPGGKRAQWSPINLFASVPISDWYLRTTESSTESHVSTANHG